MAMKVSNINYKGIAHTPSLVSDKDGVASECVNLAPDNGDLKPMPMPVKKSDSYTVETDSKIVFVHKGTGYENFMELYSVTGDENTKLYLKDTDGNWLYGFTDNGTTYHYWTNGSEIVAVQSIGDTLVVSTKAGTEYLVYRKDVVPSVSGTGFSTTSSYKPIGQRPPMPVIEFRMHHGDDDVIYKVSESITSDTSDSGHIEIEEIEGVPAYKMLCDEAMRAYAKVLMSGIESDLDRDGKFFRPFMLRYAIRMKTGDYVMHSPAVLMLPTTDRCPLRCNVMINNETTPKFIARINMYCPFSTLQYTVLNDSDYSDWIDIIDGIEVFATEPLYNYATEAYSDAATNEQGTYRKLVASTAVGYGKLFIDGEIEDYLDLAYWSDHGMGTTWTYKIKSVDGTTLHEKIRGTSLFHRISSLSVENVSSAMNSFANLRVTDLSSIAALPTLPDDYNSHVAVSPSIMQEYNARLNMANVRQEVFLGFDNGFQPQSSDGYYEGTVGYTEPGHVAITGKVDVVRAIFNVKKNGKTYTASVYTASSNPSKRLDYTTYLYYPDPDCFEAVFQCAVTIGNVTNTKYLKVPMKSHDYLNGSYWYRDMKCLGEYLGDPDNADVTNIGSAPSLSQDLWYDTPNRFMMSSVGNPWHFDVKNMFDIGHGDIMALSVNAENMNAPQFGQNPIYVFSEDGIYAININADGTYNKLSYVSGDVISAPQGLGGSPTASAEQSTFFKTEKGIMMISGSTTKEIDLCMKGRVFNPKVKLLPANSVYNGIPVAAAMSSMSDIIDNACDAVPYATFVKGGNLVYDYLNKRLLVFNGEYKYMYVYDLRYDFWSKMYPTTAYDGQPPVDPPTPPNTRSETATPTYTVFTSVAMSGTDAVLQDSDGGLWYSGGQTDENDIADRKLGFYVSKPMRFGTDDFKTLTNIVHDTQISSADIVKAALYGSRNGQDYWRISSLKGTSYKFFVIVLYTCMKASSRYAYTAFQWDERLSKNKIR